VAIKAPGAAGGRKPAKVIHADRETVVVEARFDGRAVRLTLDEPAPRIRWRRDRGRSQWTFA